MKCKHENADHLMPGDLFDPWLDGLSSVRAQCEQLRCIDCGAWLSLGPANDDDERVRIEISAARLISGWACGDDTDDTFDDPLCEEAFEHWCGFARGWMSEACEQVTAIHDAATDDSADRTFGPMTNEHTRLVHMKAEER